MLEAHFPRAESVKREIVAVPDSPLRILVVVAGEIVFVQIAFDVVQYVQLITSPVEMVLLFGA